MSDYTQNVSFGPKDALTTGDPDKLIKGTEIDAELAEISTAIATKEDESNKGVANGYASLGSDGLVPNAQLPDASETVQGVVELATTAEVVTGTDTARAVTPAGVEAWAGQNAGMVQDLANLADPGADVLIFWDESANALVTMTLGGGLSISGTVLSSSISASDLTTGTLPDARIAVTGVTQHQASLSIAETQIADGALLGRLAANETASGIWNFSNGLASGGTEVGFRRIPASGTSGTAILADGGRCIVATASITIPDAVFSQGDCLNIYNNSASAITITQGSGVTLRLGGTTSTGSRTLAARGMATIWFMSASEAIAVGAGVT